MDPTEPETREAQEDETLAGPGADTNAGVNVRANVIAQVTKLPGLGWVIRGLLTEEEQEALYHQMNPPLGNNIPQDLAAWPKSRPYPSAWANLSYTKTYHRITLDRVSDHLKMIPTSLQQWFELIQYPLLNEIDRFKVSSVYVQHYYQQSVMAEHCDQGVDWGISISLGAGCVFTWNQQPIWLRSGDIVIGRFGFNPHSVLKVVKGTEPAWWSSIVSSRSEGNPNPCRDWYRCNIQLRAQALEFADHKQPRDRMTDQEFMDMLVGST